MGARVASPFEHYLYVLRCGDGSLYTGYAVDVAARVAAHQAGRGAKYTKSHAPVSLVAQARFYSKQRAMSAEVLFKKLSRERKDALLAMAATEPLEDVLCRELPGFGDDSACEFVARSLSERVDPAYRDFMSRLTPTVDPKRMVGVRTPALRAIAKGLVRRDDAATFLRVLPHRLFEENQVHAFAIGQEREYGRALKVYNRFLPHVDNWATCDQRPVKVLAKDPLRTLEDGITERGSLLAAATPSGLASACSCACFWTSCSTRGFSIWSPSPAYPPRADNADSLPASGIDILRGSPVRAWYFAEALAKQEAAALPYLQRRGDSALLDEWT